MLQNPKLVTDFYDFYELVEDMFVTEINDFSVFDMSAHIRSSDYTWNIIATREDGSRLEICAAPSTYHNMKENEKRLIRHLSNILRMYKEPKARRMFII